LRRGGVNWGVKKLMPGVSERILEAAKWLSGEQKPKQ